jgi:23S rRNA-/tRNA-specific pseudouridylate synthase
MIKSKITGRNISKEYLALLSGLITNDEFELITLTIK